MHKWFKDLDRVLRGEATRLSALRGDTIDVLAGRLSVVVLTLAIVYGVCMGAFAIFRPGGPVYDQLLASSVKVPALFFLTLLVTFPSLYVFNALVGSRLGFIALFRLLMASLSVNVAVLASLGPIVAFFSVTTTSYPFMVLLNVLVFAGAGGLGLAFLLQTLHRLTLVLQLQRPVRPPMGVVQQAARAEQTTGNAGASAGPATEITPVAVDDSGALDWPDDRMVERQVKVVVYTWVVVFALVGSQMGWVLRPFIGAPGTPFAWLRDRQSNFFEAVFMLLKGLFS